MRSFQNAAPGYYTAKGSSEGDYQQQSELCWLDEVSTLYTGIPCLPLALYSRARPDACKLCCLPSRAPTRAVT